MIASCAFGIKTNLLTNPTNEFYVNGQKAMDLTGLLVLLKIMFISKMPFLARLFNLQFVELPIIKFFQSMVLDTMAVRM